LIAGVYNLCNKVKFGKYIKSLLFNKSIKLRNFYNITRISEFVRKNEILGHVLEFVKQYPISIWGAIKYRKLFQGVETYCMFIGYPRSGHSLTGSLLDAHPNIIIAHELNTMKYLFAGFKKNQIFYLLLKNSREFTKAGRIWSGYKYQVPNQFQGRFKDLKILGDKKGGSSTQILRTYPYLLKQLRDIININLRFFHVVRNPYDNITTISKKHKMDIKEGIDFYFSLCETIANVKKQLIKGELFEFRHEAFIENPKKLLKEICLFLGADASEDYLADCESIVFKSPHETRNDLPWNSRLVADVKERMKQFSFLEGYSYEY
jgi:hypothetical protein